MTMTANELWSQAKAFTAPACPDCASDAEKTCRTDKSSTT